jgi:site-specific DNA-methyltransferase (adenine-specific)
MNPYFERDGITIYHGDCREILPMLEPGGVDLVLTDPPYGLNGLIRGGRGLTAGGSKEWRQHFEHGLSWDNAIDDLLLARVVSAAPQAIIWGGNYYDLPPKRGWLIWDKCQEHSSGHAELAWTTLDQPVRVFRMSRVEAYGKGKDHPTQKPLRLFSWCLGFAPTAQRILDPFMGSGTTLVAAHQVGRRATGIEIEERYCEIAARRLEQAVLPLEVSA